MMNVKKLEKKIVYVIFKILKLVYTVIYNHIDLHGPFIYLY